MYRPRCWEAILFLATTSYLFSKTYPSLGEIEKKEWWTWCMFLAPFLCRTTPERKELKQDFITHLWGLEKQYINSWTESDRKQKERGKMNAGFYVSVCVWCVHALLESSGQPGLHCVSCIVKLHLQTRKPKNKQETNKEQEFLLHLQITVNTLKMIFT